MSEAQALPTGPNGSGRRISFGVIFLVLFMDLVGFGILFPLYPEMMKYYLNKQPGVLTPLLEVITTWFPQATEAQRITLFGGVLTAAYAAMQFITSPFWGRVSDRIGRRPIMLLSLTGSVIASLVWVFADSFNLLLVSRFAAAFFGGAAVAASAAVADATDTPAKRARGMALVGMAFGLGFILGPMIGGLTWHLIPQLSAGSESSWGLHPFSVPAIVAASLSLVNLAWAWRSFGETLPPERRGKVVSERSANPLVLLMGSPVQVRLNTTALAHSLLFSGMEATLGFLAWQKLQYEPQHIGFLFGAMGFTSAMMQGVIFRRFAPRTGPRFFAIIGFVLLAIGFAIIALVDHHAKASILWTGVFALACGTGLVFPALSTMTSLAADSSQQGRALGAFRSAGSLGRAFGPLLAAITYFSIGPSAPYWTGAIFMVVPLWLIASVPRLEQQQSSVTESVSTDSAKV